MTEADKHVETRPDIPPGPPTRTWRLLLAMLRRLPQRALSRGCGHVADLRLPEPLRRPILGTFARAVGMDIAEAARPLEDFPSLNALFVRRLRDGVRTWPANPRVIASPVDGIVGQLGRVEAGRALQAKGHDYSLAELTADAREAARFDGGTYITLYLSPRHYHRIHAPCPGTIARATHVPGTLLPVNAPAVAHIPGLFARNERILCYLDGECGQIAIVAIGAYNVGRISTAFDPLWSGNGRDPWVTNRRDPVALERTYDPPHPIAAGAEIMAFHLGSTVVLLLERGVPIRADLVPGCEVKVGEAIGG